MYELVCRCDECNGVVYSGPEDKLEAIKHIKSNGGYAAYGIHLCRLCNKVQIKDRHLAVKRDWRY